MKPLVIASDHAGFELKAVINDFLKSENLEVHDLGPHNLDSVDYPDYGIKLAKAVA